MKCKDLESKKGNRSWTLPPTMVGRKYLRRCLFFAITLMAAGLFVGMNARAQTTTGSISGTVKDPSGAVIPNAKVTLRDTDKNADVRKATTNSTGDFAFVELPVSHYAFTVEASGFQKFVQGSIILNVNDKLTFIATLVVGTASQVIRVEAAPLQVNTENAVAVGVVTGTQVRELTMNNRVWEQLMTLVPGVSDSNSTDQYYVGATNPFGGSATNTVGFQINGGRREETNFQVDGMDNEDRGSNLTLLSFPSVDAISEFRIVRGVYDPELGRSGGAQVNVVTRSGTSNLHGGVYEFARNNILNANQWYNNATHVNRPILRYNDFGGTVGGPVYIPHVYEQRNKTFFFVSEEARRVINYSPASATGVPSASMLTGTFPDVVCTNWANTSGVPGACLSYGKQIASINPVAAAYIKDIYNKFPTVNAGTASTPSIASNLVGIYNFHEDMVKIDHSIGNKLTINGKYLHDTIPTVEPGGLFTGYTVNGIATTSTNSPGHEYNLHATFTASPTLLVDGGYGYSYGAILSQEIGLDSAAKSPDVGSAIDPLMPFPALLGRVPTLSLTGGTGVSGYGPYNDYNRNQTAFINLSKVIGAHTLRFGAIGYHYNKHENLLSGSPNGSFSFINTNGPSASTSGGTVCGSAPNACGSTFEQSWANFLLGNDSSFAQASLDVTANVFDNQIEYYGQDTWRVRPNLTITYGLRHSFFREPTDGSGTGGTSRLINFDPALYDPKKAPCVLPNGNLDVILVNGLPTSSVCNPNYTPLNGFIYVNPPTYNGFTGMKSPFGSKVGSEFDRAIAPRFGIAWDPTGKGRTSVRAGYGMFYDNGLEFGNPELNVALNPGFLTNLTFNNTTFASPTGSTTTTNPAVGSGAAAINDRMPINYKSPYMQQWSVDVQMQVQTSWLFDIGYYGNAGTHLPGFIDTNAPVPGAWQACTVAPYCASGPNTVQITGAASGTGAGGAACNGKPCVTSSNTTLLNAVRPHIGYAGAYDFEDIYTSNYNSLQMQVQKKLSGNASVNIAYTFSHGLTTYQADRSTGGVMPQSYNDIAANYGPNIADRRHVLSINFVWDLPWMRSQKGPLGHLLGGWEFSGVQTAQTGLPLTPILSSAGFVDTAGVGCLGTTPCSLRPDLVGNPNWGPHQSNLISSGEWFNPNAYQCYGTNKYCVPYTGQSGIGDSSPGTARGPGFWRTDLGLFKNIKFTERLTGQFRLETFNTFNHVNPIQPGTGGSSLLLSSAVYDEVLLARDPRLIQLGMKLNF